MTDEEFEQLNVEWMQGVLPCPKCGEFRTKDGHDPCIKSLPGVRAACCGHGVREAYVLFEDGLVIRGQFDHLDSNRPPKIIWTPAIEEAVARELLRRYESPEEDR